MRIRTNASGHLVVSAGPRRSIEKKAIENKTIKKIFK
tara:strand:- start:686 stop:796 length:111 start_codon:yes stop_codon:yes gene_type:complete